MQYNSGGEKRVFFVLMQQSEDWELTGEDAVVDSTSGEGQVR